MIGHTSTSVSLACGLAKARDLKGDTGNVIAVIGDGSLSGGEAFEGLNNAAELGTNFIVIVNDNQMSIAEIMADYTVTCNCCVKRMGRPLAIFSRRWAWIIYT